MLLIFTVGDPKPTPVVVVDGRNLRYLVVTSLTSIIVHTFVFTPTGIEKVDIEIQLTVNRSETRFFYINYKLLP